MDKIILYGAGKRGEEDYLFLEQHGLADSVYAFCDRNAENIRTKCGKNVLDYHKAKSLGLPFVISVWKDNKELYQEIQSKLQADGVEYYDSTLLWMRKNMDLVKISREHCANYHITDMDRYFDIAESDSSLNVFWDKDTLFYQLFQKLNLENVVELACGRGRHVPKYLPYAGQITLVDILEKNIDIVKERFKDCTNIHYYQNNGYDLSELPDEKYTSLFTYDAMVHFELLDIFNYLKETYRILTPGGYALFHHSNDSSDYTNSFANCSNASGRNFMDKKLFAYLAYRAGFEIVEQHVIDWSSQKDLDCITLLKK